MLNGDSEALARALRLEDCRSSARLRMYLNHRLMIMPIAEALGVACVPQIMARVNTYAMLRDAARELGPDLVVKTAWSNDNHASFLISDENDWRQHVWEILAAGEVKIMKRIKARHAAVLACVTRYGTNIAPLQTESPALLDLIRPGSSQRGNRLSIDACGRAPLSKMCRAALTMGKELKEQGFRGHFKLDFLIEKNTGALYLGEDIAMDCDHGLQP